MINLHSKNSRHKKSIHCGRGNFLPRIESLESRTLLSTTWFVATNGVDTNPGTIGSPFRTIQHAANKAGAGDTVDVRAGTYREDVTVPNSGTASAPIVFQPYNGESVTIDGANPIAGWTSVGGSLYTASMPTNLGSGNNQVFVDGLMMNEARWPNTSFNLSHPTFATVGSTTGVTSTSATIHDSHLTQAKSFWVGATLHIGAGQDWVFQTGTVTASGPGYVTFSYTEHNAQYQAPSAGNHYSLSGVQGALDSAGEWYRSSSGKLYLRTPKSDNPAGHLVEAKARLYGFDLSNASYIRVQGFHFFACTVNTGVNSTDDVFNYITGRYLSQFSIDVNGFQDTTPNGIILRGTGDVLENSVIADTAGDGVWATGNHVSVTNNLIHDVDYSAFDAAAIKIGGYEDSINYNTCYNCGRDGMLYTGNRDTITHNTVYDYGLQTTDLGGFYTSGYSGNGTVIAYNDFHDGYTGGYGGVGIMFDRSTNGFIVDHNIVYHVNSALRMNATTHNMKIYLNTLSGNYSIDKDGLTDNWSGVVIEDNILPQKTYLSGAQNLTLSHNVTNNGKFADAAKGNFYLVSGAPAIDAGLVLPPYTNGYKGKGPDDGALEYGIAAFSYGAVASKLPKDPTA
ncbi:MAG TPA: right-handed parallel beta-helix repeat-containing protein [Humisphaera sp.]|nr:right-handed parallel beta-helix repeat-containing protein [Humisphaera sp.]